MVGQDVPRQDPESGLLPDLLVLAGLVLAFGLFLGIALTRQPDRPASQGEPLKIRPGREAASAVLIPDVQAWSKEAREAILTKSETDPPRPEAEPFLAALRNEKLIAPPIDPAVAEKPAALALPNADSENVVMERPWLSETELAKSLGTFAAPVGLDKTQSLAALEKVRLVKHIHKRPRAPEEAVLALLNENSKTGLPFVMGSECELELSEAVALDGYSRLLTRQISRAEGLARRHPQSSRFSDRDQSLALALKNNRNCQAEKAIPALLQILQVESVPVRLQLVEMLEGFGSSEATEGLLNRAVFDLSPEVRESANAKLNLLYHSGYRRELLKALRYPWPEVAWNAAEALAALKDTEAVPELIELLDSPDPSLPTLDGSGRRVVKELVGINHVQNCLLCHPPSRGKTDRVRRVVPTELTTSSDSRSSSRYGSSGSSSDLPIVLVRADVTYLRQDFSVMQRTGHGFSSHVPQRIDYLVRTRDATPEEISRAESPSPGSEISYPQRDAVLYALRNLTGQNPGPESDAWRRLEF